MTQGRQKTDAVPPCFMYAQKKKDVIASQCAHWRGNLPSSARTSIVCNGTHPGLPTYRQPSSETMFGILLRTPSHLPGLSDRAVMPTLLFTAFLIYQAIIA